MPESGIDYKITVLCRKIRYLLADMRCEITNELTTEYGSELQRPHMHHYFHGAGIPWEFRHNPAYFVCLSYEAHEVNVDAPHKDNHAFRRRLQVILAKYNLGRLVVLREAEKRLAMCRKGRIIITEPTIQHKKRILAQLKVEFKRVESDFLMDRDVCQVDPRLVGRPG